MRNKFTLLLLFSLFNTNSFSQQFSKISKSVSDYEYKTDIRKVRKDKFLEVRKKLDTFGRLSFINECDTIFMLESSNIENGSIYGKIWCSSGTINYYFLDGFFYFDKTMLFTDYCTRLIQLWDTATIRHEERLNPAGITPNNIIGTRIIKKNENVEISCILFKDFFLLERDR